MSDIVLNTAPRDAQVSVHLDRNSGEPSWHVTAIQADLKGAVTRIDLKTRPTLAEVLVSQLARDLDRELATLADSDSRILNDHMAAVPGAALVGLHLRTHRGVDQTRYAIVSFLRVLGNALAIMHPNNRPMTTLPDDRENLATQVLIDLIQPCLDIIRAGDAGTTDTHRDVLIARLQTLKDKGEELEFIASLLTRLISQSDPEAERLPARA